MGNIIKGTGSIGFSSGKSIDFTNNITVHMKGLIDKVGDNNGHEDHEIKVRVDVIFCSPTVGGATAASVENSDTSSIIGRAYRLSIYDDKDTTGWSFYDQDVIVGGVDQGYNTHDLRYDRGLSNPFKTDSPLPIYKAVITHNLFGFTTPSNQNGINLLKESDEPANFIHKTTTQQLTGSIPVGVNEGQGNWSNLNIAFSGDNPQTTLQGKYIPHTRMKWGTPELNTAGIDFDIASGASGGEQGEWTHPSLSTTLDSVLVSDADSPEGIPVGMQLYFTTKGNTEFHDKWYLGAEAAFVPNDVTITDNVDLDGDGFAEAYNNQMGKFRWVNGDTDDFGAPSGVAGFGSGASSDEGAGKNVFYTNYSSGRYDYSQTSSDFASNQKGNQNKVYCDQNDRVGAFQYSLQIEGYENDTVARCLVNGTDGANNYKIVDAWVESTASNPPATYSGSQLSNSQNEDPQPIVDNKGENVIGDGAMDDGEALYLSGHLGASSPAAVDNAWLVWQTTERQAPNGSSQKPTYAQQLSNTPETFLPFDRIKAPISWKSS